MILSTKEILAFLMLVVFWLILLYVLGELLFLIHEDRREDRRGEDD